MLMESIEERERGLRDEACAGPTRRLKTSVKEMSFLHSMLLKRCVENLATDCK
jgi:hypothetical protein